MTLTRIDEFPTLEVISSTARTSGDVLVIGVDSIGIVADTVASGVEYRAFVSGKHELAKNTGVNLTVGEDCYWDVSEAEITTVATSNTRLGVVARSGSTLSSKGRVLLNHPNVQLVAQT